MNSPLCPHCGNPVTPISEHSNRKVFGSDVVWNEDWKQNPPRCHGCGYAFIASLKVHSGHTSPLKPAESEITVQPGVSSAWTFLDHLDYQPFIEIQIQREIAGETGGLSTHEQIRLTPEEWQVISAKLRGSLLPLLQQQPWWIDTT